MGSIYVLGINSILQRIPDRDGYLVSPPVAYNTLAQIINDASDGEITNGHYRDSDGTIQGVGRPKNQDAFFTGTGHVSLGQTGRAFTIASGTGTDSLKPGQSNNYCLYFYDMSNGSGFDASSDDQTSQIENASIVLTQGVPAVGLTPTPSTYYLRVGLSYGARVEFRVVFEWRSPIRLEKRADGGAWTVVAQLRRVGDYSAWHHQNGGVTPLKIEADYSREWLMVSVGNGYTLEASLTGIGNITQGKIRFEGLNCWASCEYYPLRYDKIQVKGPKRPGLPPLVDTVLRANALAKTHTDQTTTGDVAQDDTGAHVTVEASLPDAGDGLGSTQAPQLSDATIIQEAVWSGGLGTGVMNLHVEHVLERERWDQTSRTITRSATVTCQNLYGEFGGLVGNFAIDLEASNGGPFYTRFRAIAEAPRYERQDPHRKLVLAVVDASKPMHTALAQEVIGDNWAKNSAVRFLAECGSCHPDYMTRIPFYRYGPADADCPYIVLPRGTGNQPKVRFDPQIQPWDALMALCQDSNDIDPFLGLPVPYMMGFSHEHIFQFEPSLLRAQIPTMAYYDDDPSGLGQIQQIAVYSSVEDLRTGLEFQGLDAFANELLYVHQEMPDWVKNVVGYRDIWLERNARFASEQYIQYIVQGAEIMASLIPVWATIQVPFQPWVHAGDVVIISDNFFLGGQFAAVVEEGLHQYGIQDMQGLNTSLLTCRMLDTIVG